MNQPSKDVADYLAAQGLGAVGTDIFYGQWGTPDTQLCILDATGIPSDMPDTYEQPGVQVLARGTPIEGAAPVYGRARAAWEELVTAGIVTINGVIYQCFEPQAAPFGLGRDENSRHVYTMNFWTLRNPT
jgi:hypothetical protein